MALLWFPDQWKKVQADRSLIPNMVEESLRFNSPAQCLTRVAMADTEICGVKIAKGEIVLPLLASANHDELLFSESEKFDVRRNAKGHLSFGVGIHFCLGSPLARLQARIAFEELFASVTALERIDAKPLTWIDSFFFRGVRELGLRFHQ